MKLCFSGQIDGIEKGIELISGRLGFTLGADGYPVAVRKCDGNIEVEVGESGASICYNERHHFFRAMGLLAECLKERKYRSVSERPRFRLVGLMADVSRNAVLTVDSIKYLLENMAIMGLNMLMLYAEDTYEIKQQPYFGYMRGRYTYEELKECDDHAELFGIEIIPCIQTLAHLASTLRWRYASEIKDTEDILLAGNEKTYKFIDQMVQAASKPFRSKRIHIGMDEAHNLGLGRYLSEIGYRRRFDIMNEHLKRVSGIVKKHGLQPMIWSDMYMRLASKTGDYYDAQAEVPQDVIENIPDDVQLVYWDYYHNNTEEYELFLQKHKAMGRDPLFAGGIWTWNGISIHYDKTFVTTNAALNACKRHNISEVFATMWGDNGAETNLFSALLGMQLYAEHAYSGEFDSARLAERFKACTGYDAEAFLTLGKFDAFNPDASENAVTMTDASKMLLWQDPLIGLFDRHVERWMTEYYADLSDKLTEISRMAGEMQFVFDMPSKLASVLTLKCDLGIMIKENYDRKDLSALRNIAECTIPELTKRVTDLRKAHRAQWLHTYKPLGWEILDIRYGGLLARLDTAKSRLTDYIEGQADKIEELEQERLYFDGPERPQDAGFGCCNDYRLIVSANSL